MSWYKSPSTYTERQLWYLNFLENTFIIRNAKGEKMQYKLEDFQKDFHASSLIALSEDKWQNRWVIKSRGIGATTMTMIDYICYASLGAFQKTVFPVTSYKERESNRLISRMQTIIKDTEDAKGIDFQVDMNASSLYFNEFGCEIVAIPGGSDVSLRGYRSPSLLLDELEFYARPDQVYDSGESIITEGGQIDAISTIISYDGFFYKQWKKVKEQNLGHAFEFPLYDKTIFNPALPLTEQKCEPIGWWFNLKDLEMKRERNNETFMREYQATPVDEGVKFYPLHLILRRCEDKKDIKIEGLNENQMLILPKVMGIDIASTSDYAAIVEFTFFNGVWLQTYLDKLRKPLPELQDYIDKLIDLRKPNQVNLDCTGQGLQIYQYLNKKYGGKINGIHFATKVDGQKVREFMAINLRTMMYENKITMINDESLIAHLNGWDSSLAKCSHTDGHGDIAVAIELAMLPSNKIPINEKTRPTVSGYAGFGRRF